MRLTVPVLHRLQAAGWLAADREDVDPVAAGRPARRYYRLTGEGIRSARPTEWERFLVTDRVLVEPMFYLACTPYAITAARPAPAAVAGPAAVPVLA